MGKRLFKSIGKGNISGKSSRGKGRVVPSAEYRFLDIISEHPGQGGEEDSVGTTGHGGPSVYGNNGRDIHNIC
jgi:hypothetical protein